MSCQFKIPKNSYQVLRLALRHKTKVLLTLSQLSEENYVYKRLLLAKIGINCLEYIDGFHGNDLNQSLDVSLQSGSFLISVEAITEQELPLEYSFSLETKTDYPVKIENLGIPFKEFSLAQREIVRSFCKKDLAVQEKNYEPEAKEIKRFFGNMHGIVFLYYVNYCPTNELEEKITDVSEMDLHACHPFQEKVFNHIIDIKLLRNQEVVIIYKTTEKKIFRNEITEHFEFQVKLKKADLNPKAQQPLNSEEYLDDEALASFLHFDNLKEAAYRAKVPNQVADFEIPEFEECASKKDLPALEIEVESENDQIDQNELFDSLLSDTSNQVFSCEVSAIKCFDSIIGKRIKPWIDVLLITSSFSLLIAFMQSVIRPNILDSIPLFLKALIFASILSQLVTKTITKISITVTMGMLIYSFLLDFIWMLLFKTIFNGQILVVFSTTCPYLPFKILALVLTLLNFLGKIWLFMVLWRFRVKYRHMKRLSEKYHTPEEE